MHVRFAFYKFDASARGRIAAIQEPQIPVARDIDQSWEGASVALEVHQDRRRDFIPIPGVVRIVLKMSLDRAGGDIQSDGRGNIQVVTGARVTHPWATGADAPASEVGGGVGVAGDPH